jgi:SAM-dependent methyltransferase
MVYVADHRTRSQCLLPMTRKSRPLMLKKNNHTKNGKRLTAVHADKYELYEKSVQDPDFEIKLFDKIYRRSGKTALNLREDFCGTALLCARWVKGHADRVATGIDLDPEVLAWGKMHHIEPLGNGAKRVQLKQADVLSPSRGQHDVIAALNFSYWVFKTRDVLRQYFRQAKRRLAKNGIFVIDAYGGWESQEPMLEPRRIPGGFTYVWDQDGFDPISHDVLNHIHFEFPDKTKLERAFTYDWRFWTIPELQEVMREAGFADVAVWWDDTDNDDNPVYQPQRHVSNQPGWVAYIVGRVEPSPLRQTAAALLSRRRSRG